MTALPLQRPRLLTVAEFAALPEDSEAHYELQEGNIVMSPTPRPRHQRCLLALALQLTPQVPAGLEVLPEIDIDLELVPPHRPGFVRAPDLVVVSREALARVEDSGLLRASEVRLVIEIPSPGSHRTDQVIKYGEYADAGIEHYWIVDIDERVSLTTAHLGGEFGYVDSPPRTGAVTIGEPFSVRLDLDALR